MHRVDPAPEGEVRPWLQPGGEAQGGADWAPAGGAAAQRDPEDIPSRCSTGEVSHTLTCAPLNAGSRLMRVLFFQFCDTDGLQDPDGGREVSGRGFLSAREG